MTDTKRIIVCMPCHGMFAPETAQALATMMLRIGLDPPDGMESIGMLRFGSSNLSYSRSYLADRSINLHKATHILWIDADMDFPADSLHRLLAHGVPIVGANYTRRADPFTPSALSAEHECIYTTDETKGIVEAGILGFGLLLTHVDVFKSLQHPWFAQHDNDGYCTEDTIWCRKVRESGQQIWLDHDLSKEVKHIGSVAFAYSDAQGGK